MKADKRGFTLIELIVVIIIVGILAAIAVPMMASMKAKAICTEALTTMGAIRNACRAHSLEDGVLNINTWLIDDTEILNSIGIATDGLRGVYFGEGCYYVQFAETEYRQNPGSSWNLIQCHVPAVAEGESAPRAGEALNITDDKAGGYFSMDIATGHVTQYGISRSGYDPLEQN